MKCGKCRADLVHDHYGNSWCQYCNPSDTDVGTCLCGGIQDEFYIIEWDDFGRVPFVEYRCRVCGDSEIEPA